MWRDNLIKLINESGLTTKQIAERGNLSEKTVIRIKSSKNCSDSLYVSTLLQFATALNCDLKDILVDTNAVVGSQKMATLQENVNVIDAERELLVAENTTLKNENKDLKNEIKLLEKELLHKDEIIALHKIILGMKKE